VVDFEADSGHESHSEECDNGHGQVHGRAHSTGPCSWPGWSASDANDFVRGRGGHVRRGGLAQFGTGVYFSNAESN